jgi:hypothetical protein
LRYSTGAAVATIASAAAVTSIAAVATTDRVARGIDLTGVPSSSRSTIAGDATIPTVTAITAKSLIFIDDDVVQSESAVEVLDAAAKTGTARRSRLSGTTRLTRATGAARGSRRVPGRTVGSVCSRLASVCGQCVCTYGVTVEDRQVGQ